MRRVFNRTSASLLACATSANTSSFRYCAAASEAPAGMAKMDTPDSAAKLEDIANTYSQLTLKEVSYLQRMIFKKLGHSDDFYEQALLRGLGGGGGGGGGQVVMAAPAAVAAPAAAEEAPKEEEAPKKKAAQAKTSFDVKLSEYPKENKIKLIKELRAVTNLPLKEAKDAIDKCPGLVATNMGKEDCDKLKELFEKLGAKIELL